MWEEDITDIVARIKKKLLHDEEEVKYRTIVEDKDLPKHIKSLFKNKVKYFFQTHLILGYNLTILKNIRTNLLPSFGKVLFLVKMK
jgi:hypothetical protein